MDIVIRNISSKQFRAIKAVADALDLEVLTEKELEELEELEDNGLAIAMQEARKEGYLSPEESEKVIHQFRDEVKNYKKISKRPGKSK